MTPAHPAAVRVLLAAALLLVPAASIAAQGAAPRYRPAADTVFVETVNPYRMYWVRGADTLGSPVQSVSVEAQRWRAAPGGRLAVAIRQTTLTVSRREKIDSFTVRPDGIVEQVDGHAPGLDERVDLTLHLPARPLAVGVRWADTLATEGAGPGGPHAYAVARSYRVARVVDTLGARLTEVAAEGTVRYRDGWWADSAAGTYAWLDVTGPVAETFWFDAARGRLVARRWRMELRGRGGVPRADGRGVDTLPAGLHSAEVQRVIPATRARLLARPLPGADTSLTVAAGPVLLHTVARGADTVASGLARNDGMVGTARARFAAGRPALVEVVWTDTARAVVTRRVVRRGDALVYSRGGGRDTTLAPPATGVWAVADYGMDELLVPALVTVPRDGAEHPFAVFRPFAGHWDTGSVTAREAGDALLVAYRLADDATPTALLITRDGDLLLAESSGPRGAQRVPSPGGARKARLEALLAALKGGR